ncbi:MAG: hypothetical protein ABIF71_05175 [Planctomycetota bacterium]
MHGQIKTAVRPGKVDPARIHARSFQRGRKAFLEALLEVGYAVQDKGQVMLDLEQFFRAAGIVRRHGRDGLLTGPFPAGLHNTPAIGGQRNGNPASVL